MTDVTSHHARHDFRPKTIEHLAKRVAFRCSNPDCRLQTIGPQQGGEGTVNVGVAAHITAASMRGPRYDASLTPEERRHQSNGIWLCQIHGKQVDSDEHHFTVAMLQGWKERAEGEAAAAIMRLQTSRPPQLGSLLDDEDLEFALKLGFSAEESFGSIKESVWQAACADIFAFKKTPGFPQKPIALDLSLAADSSAPPFDAPRLAHLLDAFNEIAVVASPGTGKTTTMIQLVQCLVGDEKLPAVYVPLNEWASQGGSFFESLATRKAFQNLRPQHFMLLAEAGQLALILDGWNELDDASRRRATAGIKALRRDYPDLRIVVSTRQQARDIPLAGPVVQIQSLSENKQLELARSLRQADGEAIVDHAWRTPGLRELVSIPLYLKALLSSASGETLPATKEEVLRMFVEAHDRADPGAEALREKLFGLHSDLLIGLAVAGMNRGATALRQADARAAVRAVEDRFIAEGQLSSAPQPTEALAALVDYHILVRSGTDTIAFQHQQFQEWYASFEVEAIMRSSHGGDRQAHARLRAEVLNFRVWEEAILFACDRASRADAKGVEAAAAAVLDSIEIDPLLGAEMIYRSDEAVWRSVSSSTLAFIEKWHVPGRVDRAVQFMISSGRPEFSIELWRLISDPDSQIHLAALRAGRRFRPSVLGLNPKSGLASLPDDVRVHVLSEIAGESGMDGIELATELACTDASAAIKIAVIEALLFRRADRFAVKILQSASEEVWQDLARKGYASEVADPESAERLRTEERHWSERELSPIRRLLALEHRRGELTEETAAQVRDTIGSSEFPINDQHGRWALQVAYDLCPMATCQGLIKRLEKGLEVPFGAEDYFRGKDFRFDEGPLVTLVFNPDERNRVANAAARLVGPQTIGHLIDRVMRLHIEADVAGKWDDGLRREYHTLTSRIANSDLNIFIEAVLTRAETTDVVEIGNLAQMIARHGAWDAREQHRLAPAQQAACAATIENWANALIPSERSTRAQLASLAQAIEKVPDPKLFDPLSRMLAEELLRRKRERAVFLDGLHRGRQIQNGSHMSWDLQYRRAFLAIGGPRVEALMVAHLPDAGYCGFGETAAAALKDLTDLRLAPMIASGTVLRSQFAYAEAARAARSSGVSENVPAGEAIFAVVRSLLSSDLTEEARQHATALTVVACLMPHTGKEDLITSVLHLPGPAQSKQRLLKALAMMGEVLDTNLVLAGLNELLAEAKTSRWLLDESSGRLDGWLELLPFSDRPTVLIDVIGSLEPELHTPWRLRRVLVAVGYAPPGDAEAILARLAQRDARLMSEHEWINALKQLGTVAAGRVLLDSLRATAKAGREAWTVADMLASIMRVHPELRRDVYERYAGMATGPDKDILAHVIAEAPDLDGLMLLVTGYGLERRTFDQTLLSHALRQMLTARHESSRFKGMQEVFSLPAAELRRELFALIPARDSTSRLAIECLEAIDEMREHYGIIQAEPRHPDISSGLSWPAIADWRRPDTAVPTERT